MTEPIARMNAFRAAVVAKVGEALPGLGSCKEQFGRFDLDELETNMVKTPAVRVAVLSAALGTIADARASAAMNCAAFVITEGSQRDQQAWTIAEAIAVQLHAAQLFGLTYLSAPNEVKIQPVLSAKTKQKAVVIMAIEWKQELRNLGATIFDESKHLLRELYVNDEEIELPSPAPEEEGEDG